MANETVPATTTRRQFLKGTGVLAGASAVAWATGATLLDPSAAAADVPAARNDTVRMVQDLARALARPIESRRWAMVIDARRCIGCHACTVACIAENSLPVGVAYRTVPIVSPTVQSYFMPTNCMQCENAPCIAAANAVVAGAMNRRPDGVVTIDYTRMKGRAVNAAAEKACPYSGALSYDAGLAWTAGTPARQPYETRRSPDYGGSWSRAQTKGTTRKCHFCVHRVDAGVLPACVSTCTGQAMHFGDISDGDSLVAELLAGTKTTRIENGAHTSPRVYYVSQPLSDVPAVACRTCHD
jgi:molybdopterin-containing oxidoreductase family iron-sulfur binding subunit